MNDNIIKSKFHIGQIVWWVHCSGKVYEGTVERQHLCPYQGAVYLSLHSPLFELNNYPNVHYSNIFTSLSEARKFAKWRKGDNTLPICQGCKYNMDGLHRI